MEHFIGVDIGGTKMVLCAQKEGGGYLETFLPTGKEFSAEQIKSHLQEFLQSLPFPVHGVGMAIPCLISQNREVVRCDAIPGLAGMTAEFLSDGAFPIQFLNDLRCAALAEAANYPDDYLIAVVLAGSGTALGIADRGRLLTGRGFSGELGYTCMAAQDGHVFRADDMSGGNALLRRTGDSLDAFLARIRRGESQALEEVRRAGFYFGLALANVIGIFNPHVLVVGGGMTSYPGYLETALACCKKYALEQSLEGCLIARPKDEKRIVALGAMEFIRRIQRGESI